MSLTLNPRIRRNVIGLNIAFWLLFVTLISFGIGRLEEPDRNLLSLFFQGAFGVGLLIVPITYFNTLVLIPRFLVTKKYWQYVLSVLLITVFWPPIPVYLDNVVDSHLFNVPAEELDDPFSPIGSFVMGLVFMLSTMVNIAYRWLMQQGRLSKIENEQLLMELSLLRNQISPHFFFNTLNNLYALSLQESKETPKVILKLSEMMRYTIYDCNATHVPLKNEVTYLENYISLQEIRHHQRADVSFDKDILNDEVKISPLVLIVFVENAFKHGVDGSEAESFVKMKLSTDADQLWFSIRNSIATAKQEVGGIGLENVRKRLDLVYGKNYQLDVEEKGDVFSVDLKINLN